MVGAILVWVPCRNRTRSQQTVSNNGWRWFGMGATQSLNSKPTCFLDTGWRWFGLGATYAPSSKPNTFFKITAGAGLLWPPCKHRARSQTCLLNTGWRCFAPGPLDDLEPLEAGRFDPSSGSQRRARKLTRLPFPRWSHEDNGDRPTYPQAILRIMQLEHFPFVDYSA